MNITQVLFNKNISLLNIISFFYRKYLKLFTETSDVSQNYRSSYQPRDRNNFKIKTLKPRDKLLENHTEQSE